MATPKEKDGADYLKKYKIMELMNNLTSMLLFHRPESPREFLIDQLEQLKVSKQSSMEGPSLFNDSDLDAIFGILDPTNQEYISYAQYKGALATLGISNINEFPAGAGEDKISRDTFKTDAKEGLRRS
ncbi:EF-hand calcium-binding domain-containing protein 10 [Lampris incognitus]|uniref:EF-hand calcium-binding domain-containing protein 10 n=1 Tax=Lampris incognitus TaxID=2546036 RepID=UPI0024B58414|nr:EF-hand calcium-binding domain-containing protein 10 [Lampris incognitus]